MRTTTLLCYSCMFFVFVVTSSCQNQELDQVGETYLDESMLQAVPPNSIGTNPTFQLGRVLFYDRQLSLNNTIACASCHKQAFGFADNQKFSRGFETRLTSRNSMPLQNLFGVSVIDFAAKDVAQVNSISGPFGNHFFWDGREQNLMSLVLQPIGNHVEMGIKDAESLTRKISEQPYYSRLFSNAFNAPDVTVDKVSLAITTFISSINTFNTRFDRYNNSKINIPDTFNINDANHSVLTPLELEGMMLFQDKYDCNSCHQVQSPNGYVLAGTFANVGLEKNYTDNGLAGVTGKAEDIGKFKIPSLRNVAYTAPYMHDGRFETLDEVVEHYSEGIIDNPGLDEKLKDAAGNARSMNITEHEKKAIIAFLHTLSDESVIKDPAFSNPFKVK